MTTAIRGPQRRDRAVGLVALDDEPALARAGVAAELRHLGADQERRVEAEPVEANAIIAAVVVLPCAPATTIDVLQRDELGEEAPRGSGPRRGPRYAVETTASQPSGAAGGSARDLDLDAGRAHVLEIRRLDPVPARRPPPPTRCASTA